MTDEEKWEVKQLIEEDKKQQRWWKEIEVAELVSRNRANSVLLLIAYLLIGILLAKVLFL